MSAANQRKPFSAYTVSENGKRSLEEATSELQREIDVRRRLFDKWTSDGKQSWVEAHDRLERLMTALKHLLLVSEALTEQPEEAQHS